MEEAVNSTIERKPINEDAVKQNFIIDGYHFYEIIHHRTASNDYIRLQYFSKQNRAGEWHVIWLVAEVVDYSAVCSGYFVDMRDVDYSFTD